MARQLFRQIADDLHDRIISGDLKSGDKLPTHEQLMRDYQTTRVTVRRALDELLKLRLVVGRQPVGMFVADQHRYLVTTSTVTEPAFSPAFPQFIDQFLGALPGPHTQTVDVEHVRPLEGISRRLRSEAPVVLRHRVMCSDGKPSCVVNSHFPAALAAGTALEAPVLIEEGIFAALDRLGLVIRRLRDEIFIRPAEPSEAAEMGWPVGVPVFGQIQTAFTGDDEPVMCSVALLPGESWVFGVDRVRVVEPVAAPDIRQAI